MYRFFQQKHLAATQQFAALIRITEVNGGTASFTEDLQDTTSPAFQALATDVENTVSVEDIILQ